MPDQPSSSQLIAVVTGGRSTERERSLLSGRTVLASLQGQGYQAALLDAADPGFVSEIQRAQVAFLAIAGQYAEDGKLQGFLETVGIAYTGSPVAASAIAMHKTLAKSVVAAAGVPVLPQAEVPAEGTPDVVAKALLQDLDFPVILKPCSEGGSIGMTACHSRSELIQALGALDRTISWFAESFVTGTPVTCAVLEDTGSSFPLPVLETLPLEAEFYDYATKRDETLHRYRCPAQLPDHVVETVSQATLDAHRALGCAGYSRSDFVIGADGRPFWLEVNTLPGLSHHGNLATMAAAAGIDYDQLVQRILDTAHTGGGYRP